MRQSDVADQQPDEMPAKKRYEKPAFQSERLFETMALSCGKIVSTQGACHQIRKNS